MGVKDRLAPTAVAVLFLLLTLVGCAAGPTWVRPERSLEENRADYAACEEATYRQLRAEFSYEVGISGSGVPGFPSQNPIPPLPARGSIARSSPDDPLLRQDIDTARVRAEHRRQQLMRECLTRARFRAVQD
ncbi:MAG: hypothetical protein IRZ04_11000 [Rhodospirillales bacterium]|nr:hypothetical protein [Rhodospirillales bacterium]